MLNKCVLVVSDLHAGSIYGMLPPKFAASSDSVLGQNPGQAYMWECWLDLVKRVREIKTQIVAVVLNGDLVDGPQRIQAGSELSIPLIADQARAAEVCLTVLRDVLPKVPWYSVQGTEYHVGRAGRECEVIAKNLGCLSYGAITAGSGLYSREVLDLDIDGVVLNFAHHISVAGGFYRATAVDREGIWSALAGKEKGLPKADVCIRSHCHFFVHVEHASKHVAITPCWQLQTRFMRKHSAYRMLPDLGALLVWLDGDLKRSGEDPVVIRKILYPLPPIKATKLA